MRMGFLAFYDPARQFSSDQARAFQRGLARVTARQIANTQNIPEIVAAQSGISPSEAERRHNSLKGLHAPRTTRDKIRAVLADMKKRGYFAPDLTEAVRDE